MVESKLSLIVKYNDTNLSTGCNHNNSNANGLKFLQEIDAKILKCGRFKFILI